jgi:hypothetical protein
MNCQTSLDYFERSLYCYFFLWVEENTRYDGMPKAENGHVGDAKHASM